MATIEEYASMLPKYGRRNSQVSNMSDQPQTTETGWLAKSEAWASHAAHEVYDSAQNALKVKASDSAVVASIKTVTGCELRMKAFEYRTYFQIDKGIVKEAVNHPLKLTLEVAGGAAMAAAGTTGALIAGGVGIGLGLGLGIYKGIEILRKEGIEGIPRHLESGYLSAKQTVIHTKDAAMNVFGAEMFPEYYTQKQQTQAKDDLQNVGGKLAHAGATFAGGFAAGPIRAASGEAIGALEGLGKKIADEFVDFTERLQWGGFKPAYEFVPTGMPNIEAKIPDYRTFASSPEQGLAAGLPIYLAKRLDGDTASDDLSNADSKGGADTSPGKGTGLVRLQTEEDRTEHLVFPRNGAPYFRARDWGGYGKVNRSQVSADKIGYFRSILRVYNENKHRIVELVDSVNGDTGGGVVIELGDGKLGVATANHVVRHIREKEEGIFLRMPGSYRGSPLDSYAKVVARDEASDLAILHIKFMEENSWALTHRLPLEKIAMDLPASNGTLLSFGYPHGNNLAVKVMSVDRVGPISELFHKIPKEFPRVDVLRLNGTLYSGMSGGGIFNLQGDLVAINSFGNRWGFLENQTVMKAGAIPAKFLMPLINKANAKIVCLGPR